MKAISFLSMLLALNVFANSMSYFSGSASVTREPECVDITFNVQGECFVNSNEMSAQINNKTAGLAETIQSFLGENDEVETSYGIVSTFSRSRGEYNDRVVECVGTFAVSNTITVKVRNLENFSEIYNQTIALSSQDGVRTSEQPFVNAFMGGFHSRVSDDTRNQMQEEAIADATRIAQGQFISATKAVCSSEENLSYEMVFNPRENYTHRSSSDYQVELSYAAAPTSARMGDASRDNVTVNYAPITVRANITIGFRHSNIASSISFDTP